MTDRLYEIAKAFSFDSAHRLTGLPTGHKCARPHGHTYTAIVSLSSDTLDAVGMVLDYGELAPVKTYIDNELDHRDLCEVFPATNPTAENLALLLACVVIVYVPEVRHRDVDVAVTIKETPGTAATCRFPAGRMGTDECIAIIGDARALGADT